MTEEMAIKEAYQNACEEYECEEIQFIHASYNTDLSEWIIEFCVWGWLTSEWRVWEYEERVYCELLGG